MFGGSKLKFKSQIPFYKALFENNTWEYSFQSATSLRSSLWVVMDLTVEEGSYFSDIS